MPKKPPPIAAVAQTTLAEIGDPSFSPDHAMNLRLHQRAASIKNAVRNAIKRRGGETVVAAELDAIFGATDGQHVSATTVRSCFAASASETRNYWRADWLVLFLDDPEVQDALAPRNYTPEEENRLTRDYLAKAAPALLEGLNKVLGRQS